MYFRWKPYVPAAARRQTADRTVAKMRKEGRMLSPVAASRGAIAKSFWGKAWCRNLERYSDYSNRLPRGRTYLRNGSVIDLRIGSGEVTAQVMGSSLYRITVNIRAVAVANWQAIARDCARSIDTLVELLQGQLSTSVMERITRPGTGLFPSPKEIAFSCSCPDSAAMCKHVAATLYGIGARLDVEPALLFALRKADAKELIARAGEGETPGGKLPDAGRILDSSKLADVFGIDFGGIDAKPSHKAKKAKSVTPRKAKAAKRVGKRSARAKSGRLNDVVRLIVHPAKRDIKSVPK
jgi:uncharacterized Zn finger protein